VQCSKHHKYVKEDVMIRVNWKPRNKTIWKIIYLLSIWAGLELGMTLAHAETVNLVPTPKPVVEYTWRIEEYVDHFYYMRDLLGVSYQTIDCQHDNATIDYFDNLRLLPGYITEIRGTEVTMKTQDKHRVEVRTFFLTDDTRYFYEKSMKASQVDRAYLESHKDGCWVVRYCAHCRVAYKLIRVEV
jgi:hypothetical protein